ncbi:hypothetical protein OB919_20185 [Halobacteria archaeon AArc-curdl1]|uniref:DUF7344 domain-containing protein n=1 Tax=Natronosalvus hydrolyticus TaxID=2979988 RepID=A0AAP3E8T3_9EURY|nr:hypothetical protein [Halobacteria archaeon AArc-curdl1]
MSSDNQGDHSVSTAGEGQSPHQMDPDELTTPTASTEAGSPPRNQVSSAEPPKSRSNGSMAPDSRPIETEVSKDDLFKVLGNRRRRHVLHYLEWRDRPVGLDELAERIAAWENDTTEEAIGSTERKRVYTALQQFHLPKLEEAHLIAYDDRDGTVARTDAWDRVDVYLDLVPEDDIPWSTYYVGVSSIGLAVTGLSAVGLPFLSLLSPIAWAACFLVVICGSGLAHVRRDRRLRLGRTEVPPEVRLE